MKLDYKVYNLVLNKPSGAVVFAEKTKAETGLADEINPQVNFFASEIIYLDTSYRMTFKYIYGRDNRHRY